MKVKEFFEELRTFPDWDVDIVVRVDGGSILLDTTSPLWCDERNGNIILEAYSTDE